MEVSGFLSMLDTYESRDAAIAAASRARGGRVMLTFAEEILLLRFG